MILYAHQIEGVDFLKSTPRALLADEPGLGKSVQSLLAAVEPILVVAPAMILDGGVWDDEVAKWIPGADVTQVAYSSLSERAKTSKGGSSPTGKPKADYRRKWGTVILDEAHYIKGRKTNWTKAVQRLQAERWTLLTGTPLPNWAHEAFTLLQLLFPDEAKPGGRLGSYWRWVEEWFEVGELRGAGGRVLSSHVVGDLLESRSWDDFRSENWRGSMLRRLREDCLDLPPLTRQTIKCPMRGAQKVTYKALAEDFIAWLDSGAEIVAWNKAAQLVKLAKCATGLEVLSPRDKSSAKLDALQDILEDRPRPTLVVAHFRDTVAQAVIRARLVGKEAQAITGETSRAGRHETIRAFQAGELDVLCATIDTISEGLTLNAADQIVFLERSWRPSRNEQALRRIHRIGQDLSVLAIDLVTPGTVDERVLALLAEKTDQQMQALGDADLRSVIR